MNLTSKQKSILVGFLLVVGGVALGLGYSAKYGPPVKLTAVFSSANYGDSKSHGDVIPVAGTNIISEITKQLESAKDAKSFNTFTKGYNNLASQYSSNPSAQISGVVVSRLGMGGGSCAEIQRLYTEASNGISTVQALIADLRVSLNEAYGANPPDINYIISLQNQIARGYDTISNYRLSQIRLLNLAITLQCHISDSGGI